MTEEIGYGIVAIKRNPGFIYVDAFLIATLGESEWNFFTGNVSANGKPPGPFYEAKTFIMCDLLPLTI